jgi:hypothetical protein
MIEIHPTPIYIIHLTETDGEIVIKRINPDSLEEYIKDKLLGPEDYAIIRGHLLKSFENNSFDINRFILKTKGA